MESNLIDSRTVEVGEVIIKLTWQNFPLLDHHVIAGGGTEQITKKQAVFITLTPKDPSKSGVFGVGEASYVTVPGRVEPKIDSDLETFLRSIPDLRLNPFEISNLFGVSPRLKYAFSVAYLDLVSKLEGIPLWKALERILQEQGLPIACGSTVIGKAVIFENELDKLRNYIGQYSRFKLKISPETFDTVIGKARDLSSQGCVVALDANFTFEERWDLVKQLESLVREGCLAMEYLEQPLKPYSDKNPEAVDKMRRLSQEVPYLKLALDQDVRSLEDCKRWAGNGYVYVIKASAFGAVNEILQAVLDNVSNPVALGGMLETVIGKTTLLHFQAIFEALSNRLNSGWGPFSAEISPVNKYFNEDFLLEGCEHLRPNRSEFAIPEGPGIGVELSDYAKQLLCP